jgi:hypothetical protein
VLDAETKRYGERTKEGSGKGLDTKSLSHALRVLVELEEILVDQTVTFPLKDKGYLLAVKLGEVTIEDVMEDIDVRYERCMDLIDNSNLPDKSSIDTILETVKDFVF